LFEGKDYRYGIEGTFYVSECEECGLWFQNPRPALEHLTDLYPEDYSPHDQLLPADSRMPVAARNTRYLRRYLGYTRLRTVAHQRPDWTSLLPIWFWHWYVGVKLMPRYVPAGRLLEVGCASGTQLSLFRHLGWKHLHGIELIPKPARAARQLGFAVKCGPVETVIPDYPDGYFDVIYSTMVLEHLYDPFHVVNLVARKLKPGGQFLFSTVIRDSLDVRMYGVYSRCFDLPRHLIYFRKPDLYQMLEPCFEKVECFHQAAPQDFTWPAIWRRKYGEAKLIDWAIVALGRSLPARVINMLAAWARLSLRVSFRCRRKP
jgi:SAM-dependent methyltransferase